MRYTLNKNSEKVKLREQQRIVNQILIKRKLMYFRATMYMKLTQII